MSCLPGRSAASSLMCAALGMRMFWGLAVDFPFAMNASWMCPLLGLLLYLPFGFAVNLFGKSGTGSIWNSLAGRLPLAISGSLCGIFVLLLIYDSAVALRLLASSANLIALNDVTVHLLLFPLIFVVAAVILLGSDAAGNSARIWLKLLPLFAAIVLAVQLKSYRAGWITPVLGGGIGSIISGSIYCAGCMTLAALIWLPAQPDRCKRGILFYISFASIVVSVLLLMQHLSFPSLINIPFTRAARIELILSNGRMSLSPQLVLDVVWFGSLLQLISAEVCTASVYLQLLLPKLPKWLKTALISATASIAAVYNPEWLQSSSEITLLLFPAIGGIFVFLMLIKLIRKGKKKHAHV